MFKKRGVTVSDTNTSDTKAVLANITDPYMARSTAGGLESGAGGSASGSRWYRIAKRAGA